MANHLENLKSMIQEMKVFSESTKAYYATLLNAHESTRSAGIRML